MQMTFDASSSVTLLFDFWDVRGPAGMVVSVFVVLLLTLFYEVLKVWRVWLSSSSRLARSRAPYSAPSSCPSIGGSMLEGSASESSLSPADPSPPATSRRNRWLLHIIQTAVHVLQVTLGYMVMLCVMSYNVWIFLGVIAGSVLGYFISFPLLSHM